MQKIIMICVFSIANFTLSVVSFANSKAIDNKHTCLVEPKSKANLHNKVVTKSIGIVIFDGVVTSEVTAPVEVFGNAGKNSDAHFDVKLIAENMDFVMSNENLRLLPDFTFENSPSLDVLIVPSSYNVQASEQNPKVVNFVKDRGVKAKYLASNCAGAFIVGEAGLLDGKKMVTYVGGGADLKKRFPKAIVQDEHKNTVFVDGNYVSSNGVLVSYTSALKLLEMMSGKKVSDMVKANLYYDRLKK